MQMTESAGNGASTLALKPIVESTKVQNIKCQSLHKMMTLSPQKLKKKSYFNMKTMMISKGSHWMVMLTALFS